MLPTAFSPTEFLHRLRDAETLNSLALAEPKVDVRDDHRWNTEYRDVERRMNPRHQGSLAGLISLGRDFLVECTVRNFSPAGVGLLLPDSVFLPAEFDLTFDHATHHCITVWRQPERMGLKFKSIH